MPNIEKITILGTEYDIVDSTSGYTSLQFSQGQNLSDNIVGVMTFNNITYTIYAPATAESGTLNVQVDDNELKFETLLDS